MINDKCLRVLVVDDTIVYRKIVSDVLAELPDVEVVGTASNGKIAMSKIATLKPDLLTLDIEMPEMDGLEVLARIKAETPDIDAIMLSSLTQKGSDMTIKALELGAFDFVPKPQSGSREENKKAIAFALAPMLKAFARRQVMRSILKGKSVPSEPAVYNKAADHSKGLVQPMKTITRQKGMTSEIVGIGISTGGPNALAQMMTRLPADLGVPVLIVQHMPPVFTQSLAASLNSKCALQVREAVDGETIRPNTALITPGGKQMRVVAGADGKSRIVRITDDPPENSCKPSVDYLFRSIAYHYVGRATGVIMTGMGSDGTLGVKLMKRNGATIIAQNEATCVVYGMPKEPIEAGIVDVIAPLDKIADEICQTVGWLAR
jgi:two-component system chemotaxis response regulator CheB